MVPFLRAEDTSMIRVLTIEREYGSGGAEIARKAAERLGWKLWDQSLTNEIARLMECDCRVVEERAEKRDPLFHRLMMAFMRGSHEGSLNAPRLKLADASCIREVAEGIVRKIAQAGQCVIVGRGSAYYLQDRNDAFHVFIYAPPEDKMHRLCAEGKTEEEARRLVETVDRDRAAFIKQYFGVEWPDRARFNLMINSKTGVDAVVDAILNGIALLEKRAKHGPAVPVAGAVDR